MFCCKLTEHVISPCSFFYLGLTFLKVLIHFVRRSKPLDQPVIHWCSLYISQLDGTSVTQCNNTYKQILTNRFTSIIVVGTGSMFCPAKI